MSPHTLLLVVAGTIGSIVVGFVGLILGVGSDDGANPEPTWITVLAEEPLDQP